jgi:phage gp36-like protein
MIEVSVTEAVLFAWAFIATAFWHDAHNHRKHDMKMTVSLLHEVAKGNVKVVETDDGVEIKPVRNV